MIDTIFYGIGFLIYTAFCVITFEVYSKKREVTNPMVLGLIYLYYTILVGYLLSIVEMESWFVFFVEFFIYAVACGLISFYYYNSSIKKKDKDSNLI